MKVTYFQLWARGPSIVLALEHAGVDYEAVFPDNWKELKPTTPWGALPMLEAPLAGKVLTLGHELAILAYLERKCPAVAGADEREWAVSQQFVHQAEDVYKALVAKQPTLYETDKVSKEALAEWWAGDDRTLHNRKQGLQVHLALLEAAAAATPGKAGYLTCDGKSVGECKLWATLHMLVMIKSDVLAPFPALTAFYERFGGEAATKRVVDSGGRFPGPLKQYFVAAE